MTSIERDFHQPAAPDWGVAWDELDRQFEWIAAMREVPQDPVWHAEGDVWIHTRMVCEALAAMPAWRELDAVGRRICWLAALLHDIAKPYSTKLEEGRFRSRHHSPRGAVHARRLLWAAGLAPNEREQVCGLVRHHQLPIHALAGADGERRVSAASFRCRGDYLAIVAEADIRGRVCETQGESLEAIELFRAYIEELGCARGPRAFPSEHSRLLFFRDGRPAAVEAFDDTSFEVTLMVGAPGAGKTRWVSRHLPDCDVVSMDALRRELGVAATDNQGAVRRAALERARELLRLRKPFVWDATNLQVSRRQKLIELFRAYGARVEIVVLDTAAERLWKNNAARPEPVPAKVIEGMLARWEAPDETEAHRIIRVGWPESTV